MKRTSIGSEYTTYIRNNQKFGVHIWNSEDLMRLKLQVTEIHSYNDAEYTWARYGNRANTVEFIRGGKVVDRMSWHEYDDEYYEDPSEFIDELIDQIAVELRKMNKDVEPRMMHN